MTESTQSIAKFLVSAIILVILVSQTIAGFVNTGRWGWPILAYPMYSRPHFENERLDHDPIAYAVLADSTRVKIDRDELGMDFWIYWQNVLQPIRGDNLEGLAGLIQRYCQEYDNQLVKFEVDDQIGEQGVAIGRDGPVTGLPPQVIGELDASCE